MLQLTVLVAAVHHKSHFTRPSLRNAPCGLRGCKNWPAPIPGWM